MNGKLHTDARVEDADGFYARLIQLHQGLTPAESQKLNAKLILILANHIGDRAVLADALDLLERSLPDPKHQ